MNEEILDTNYTGSVNTEQTRVGEKGEVTEKRSGRLERKGTLTVRIVTKSWGRGPYRKRLYTKGGAG